MSNENCRWKDEAICPFSKDNCHYSLINSQFSFDENRGVNTECHQRRAKTLKVVVISAVLAKPLFPPLRAPIKDNRDRRATRFFDDCVHQESLGIVGDEVLRSIPSTAGASKVRRE